MHEGGDGKNRETFPRIPDEPSKPRNFSPSKLLSFMVNRCLWSRICMLADSNIGPQAFNWVWWFTKGFGIPL